MQPEPEPDLEETGTAAEPVAVLPPPRSRRDLWLEVAAVLFIAVLPDLWNTAALLIGSHPPDLSFNEREAHLFFRSVQVSWLVLYLMARSETRWSRFGIVEPRWITDSIATFGTMMAAYSIHALYGAGVGAIVSAEALRQDTHRLAGLFKPPTEPEQTVLLIAAAFANGFAEELVVRGYLIPRFEDLFGSPVKAVLLSSALFASYHLYQGLYGAGSALVLGLVFGVAFCALRRLWPVAAAHAFINIYSMLR